MPYPTFPSNPSIGDTYSDGGTTFVYGGPVVGWYRELIELSNEYPIKIVDTPGFYGQAGRTTSATITGVTQGVYQSTGVTTTLDTANTKGLAIGVDGFSLKNITTRTVRALVFASIDASESGGNNKLGIILTKNGTIIPQTECRAQTGFGNGEAKLVTNWIIQFAPGDEVAVYITSHTSNNNISFGRGRIVATKVQP